MGEAVHARGGIWIPPAAPGFDAQTGRRHQRRRARAAARPCAPSSTRRPSSSPDAIGLISWNEFSENTHIEPSRAYGSRYLRLVGEVRGARLPELQRLRLERAGGHRRSATGVPLLGGAGSCSSLRRARAAPHPSTVGKPPIGGLSASARARLGSKRHGRSRHLPWRWAVFARLLRRGGCRPRGHGRRRHRLRSRRSRLQRRRRDGRPLPPARDLGPARWPAPLAAVLPLGDIQYDSATTAQDQRRLRPHLGPGEVDQPPVLGNHESGSAAGLLRLLQRAGRLGRPGGPARQGLLQLRRRRLAPGRAQLELRERVAARPAPRRSAGCAPTSPRIRPAARSPTGTTRATAPATTAATTFMQPLWEALHDAQAEIVLSGHSHDYERFAPLDRNGAVDQRGGHPPVRGRHRRRVLHGGLGTRTPHSEVAQNDTFGVLMLTLHPTSYDWQFVPEAGGDVHRLRLAGLPWPDRSSTAAPVGRGQHGARDLEASPQASTDHAQEPLPVSALGGGHRRVHDQTQGQGPLPDGGTSSRSRALRARTSGASAPGSARGGCGRGRSRRCCGRATRPATAPPPRASASGW